MSFFPWQIRADDQYLGVVVFGIKFRDDLLPATEGSHSAKYELEYRHFCGRVGAELGLLLLEGETQVCGTCETG